MVEVNWTEEASQWLEDIFEHISLENPAAAARVIEGIYERAKVLKEHPEIGYCYSASDRNVRILLYGHYLRSGLDDLVNARATIRRGPACSRALRRLDRIPATCESERYAVHDSRRETN